MNIVITGGSRGIGFHLAKNFVSMGNEVTICATNTNSLEEALNQINVHGTVADVRKSDDIKKLIDYAVNTMGSIDIWINNAGIGQYSVLCEMTEKQIEDVIDIDLTSVIRICKILTARFDKIHIYNMEGFGSDGMLNPLMSVYGTSKRGLRYFSRALAKEFKKTDIKVSRLSPGMVRTDFLAKSGDYSKNKIMMKLSDEPEVVSQFLTRKVIKNTSSGNLIAWLTNVKAFMRILFRRI